VPEAVCIGYNMTPPCLLITTEALNTLDSGYRLERERRVAAETALERRRQLDTLDDASTDHLFVVGVGSTCFVLGALTMLYITTR
jgi:hypothetical protein